jgi:hypothetical protein
MISYFYLQRFLIDFHVIMSIYFMTFGKLLFFVYFMLFTPQQELASISF